MKTLSGVLIDPTKKEITYHTFQYESNKDIYPILNCDLFDIVTLSEDHSGMIIMFIDDEGLMKPNHHFRLSIRPATPFAGKALILKELSESGELTSVSNLARIIQMGTSWLGDDLELEEAIKGGSIARPYQAIGSFGKDGKPLPGEVIWQWSPNIKGGE